MPESASTAYSLSKFSGVISRKIKCSASIFSRLISPANPGATAHGYTFPQRRRKRAAFFRSRRTRGLRRSESRGRFCQTPRAGVSGAFGIRQHPLHHPASVALVPIVPEGMDADQLRRSRHVLFSGRVPPGDAVGLPVQLQNVAVPLMYRQKPSIHPDGAFHFRGLCKPLGGDNSIERRFPAFGLYVGKAGFVPGIYSSDLNHFCSPFPISPEKRSANRISGLRCICCLAYFIIPKKWCLSIHWSYTSF